MSLDPQWVALVLLAAVIHASWNALNKASRDPLLSMMVLTTSGGLVAGLLIPFFPLPDLASLPWLATSIVIHFVYQISLVRAYRVGDLSQVYPIARGLAPVGVALLAMLSVDEWPTPLGALGLAISAGAIMSLAFTGKHLPRSGQALRAALTTALLISCYTVVDGNGTRATERGISYVVWLSFLDALPMLALAIYLRRDAVIPFLRTDGLRNAIGGVLANVGYGIVMLAMAQGMMATVAALRETSVIFAALIGTQLLREPFGLRRILASCAVVAGLFLLQTQ